MRDRGRPLTSHAEFVPGLDSMYFQIGSLAATASYRVTVWDYSTVEDRGKVQ